MKIIQTDSRGGQHIDMLVASEVSEYYVKSIIDFLNINKTNGDKDLSFNIVNDKYVLRKPKVEG